MAATVSAPSYLEYVRSLSEQWPRLRLLEDFASRDNKILDYHEDFEVEMRMNAVDVDVIDFEPNSMESRHFSNLNELTFHLNTKPESLQLRVLMVENLSAAIVELLGGKYSLDPRFFENHVRNIENYFADRWTGDKTARLESTSSEVLNREFFSVTYTRPYMFKGWPLVYLSRLKQNIPRLANAARNLFMREKASLYGPTECDDGYSFAIVLSDPLLYEAEPEGIYLRQNDQLPKYYRGAREATKLPQLKQVSTRSTLMATLLQPRHQVHKNARNVLVRSILSLALDFHATALDELDSLLYGMDSMHSQRPASLYQSMVEALNNSGGTIALQEYIWMSFTDIKRIFINLFPPSSEDRKVLEMELEALDTIYSTVQRRTNRILQYLQQERQIREARLNRIAFLCIPISTIAAVLGIQDVARFIAFGLLILPIFVFATLFGVIGVPYEDSLKVIDKIFGSGKYLLAGLAKIRRKKNIDSDAESRVAVERSTPAKNSREEILPQNIVSRKASYDEKAIRDFIEGTAQRRSVIRRSSRDEG
ncbi:hypothetical protein AOQ84DRAFT_385248 [Glonium stellatum]|uniref:Uncharacterized protein n=1 Tax=Glonium stellatum TaxID=574774 RepID=A0A8E2FAM5_9PEZI|nr:hypothetical protein AOQ84DRAFT_385248 [Glonium stellatum]